GIGALRHRLADAVLRRSLGLCTRLARAGASLVATDPVGAVAARTVGRARARLGCTRRPGVFLASARAVAVAVVGAARRAIIGAFTVGIAVCGDRPADAVHARLLLGGGAGPAQAIA